MTREGLIDYVATHTETPIERVKKYSNFKLLAKYLEYQGIIGYTNDIVDVIEAIYDVKLTDHGNT